MDGLSIGLTGIIIVTVIVAGMVALAIAITSRKKNDE